MTGMGGVTHSLMAGCAQGGQIEGAFVAWLREVSLSLLLQAWQLLGFWISH